MRRLLYLQVIFIFNFPLSVLIGCPIHEGVTLSRTLGKVDFDVQAKATFSICTIDVLSASELSVKLMTVVNGMRIQSWQRIANNWDDKRNPNYTMESLAASPMKQGIPGHRQGAVILSRLQFVPNTLSNEVFLPHWAKYWEFTLALSRFSYHPLLKSSEDGQIWIKEDGNAQAMIKWTDDICGYQEF